MNLTTPSLARAALLSCYFVLSGAVGIGGSGAATVTRGPYLQQGTTNSVVVRWRTDVATDSYVRFGTVPGVLTTTANDAALVTEHIISVSGLQADMKYYYEVGTSSTWFPGDANDYFATAPSLGVERSTRLWILGDSGTGNANAAAVRDAYLAYSSSRPADLLLMLGDNAYNSGTDSEYQSAVFNMYPTVLQNTILWPTIGNHDTAQSPTPPANLPYFSIFTLPQNGESGGVASGTEKYYSFDYANVHFICLDSMSSDRSTSGPMYSWLQSDLQATTQRWVIVFFHHPPYTKGSHNSDAEGELIEMRQNFLPLLEAYDVDLVLSGHSHAYERSFLIDGHYGLSGTFAQAHKKDGGDGRTNGNGAYVKPDALTSHQGSVYVVAGSSGQISGGPLNHPAMFISLNLLGSLVIDINSNRLDVTFLKTDALAGDYFTIIKSPPATNPPAAPTVLTALALSSSQINLSWVDNSTDEDGFKVERSTNGIDFVQVSSVGANVVNGIDNGLSPLTTYHYRVRAFNLAGDSPYSNIAQATTPSGPVSATLIASNSVWKYLDNGTDQGTAWRGAAFNDSAWASGAAELGYGDGGEATIVSFGPNASAKYITTYFRKSFTVANPAAYTNLLLRLVRDDGAVVYLNGVEVHRANLPSGTISFNTLALLAIGGADESLYFSTNISSANLVAGTNVIAVEIHQNVGNSTDISFNLQVTASGPGAPAGDTTAPAAIANLSVNSVTASSATLIWTAPGDDGSTGTASSYNVRYSTSPITEANWASATQAAGEPSPSVAGTPQTFAVSGLTSGTTYYFAIKTSDEVNNISPLSNVPSAATSVTPPAAPTSLTANALSSTEVLLGWVDNANNEDGFRIERSTNGVDFVLLNSVGANATAANDTTVEAPRTYHYRVRAFNSAGDSANSNVAQVTTPAPAGPGTNVVLVASNSVWKFLDNGTDQGTAWRQSAFNDSGWASGAAELGYGDGGEATVVSFGPNASAKYITTYFRKSFSVVDPAAYTNLLLRLVRDDGAVIYLNGVEVYRVNLPSGTIAFNTLALVAIAGVDESTYFSTNLSSANLVAGNNVIAVEIHQNVGNSTDISFNLQLTASGSGGPSGDTAAPAAVTDLAAGNATTNSITLTWTAPGDDGNTGTASSYDVRLSLAPITEANWASATPVIGEPAPAAAGNPENLTIIGLNPATTYYFALKTSDETNNVSPLSNVPGAATTATPPAAPTSLTANALSSTEVFLGWADNANNEDGFHIERSTNGVDFVLLNSVGANANSANDTTVQALRTYHYRVRAFNTAGESANSNVAQVTTPAANPNTNLVLVASNTVWKFLDNGTDQGTVWRQPAFDDAAWASGAAELGYGDGGEATVVSFGPDINNKYITTYFRKSFTVGNPSGFTNLLLQLVRDDGAIVYLNGVEVYRTNLPAGTVTFTTLAPLAIGGADESTYQVANLSPSALVNGANVIAVEMHQANGTSTDVSFNLQLTGLGAGTPAGDTSAPSAVIDLAAGNATTSSITLTWTAPGDDGNTGTASSYDVRLSLAPITEANWASATPIIGEPTPAAAGNIENLTIVGLNAATTYYFGLKTSDETNNVSPLSNVASATTVEPPPLPVTSVLLASNSVWKYLDNGTDQGTAWRFPAFDDSTWASGLAELGYGDGGEATVVGFGPDANNKYITTYFRVAFTIGNPAAYTNLLLQLVRDDGPVVYLNGVEVYRNNLPAGAITFTTLGLTAIGGGDESAYQSTNIPTSALVAGVNVIAVEMHQANGTSTDVSFNLQLIGTGPVIAAPEAPSGLSASAVSSSQIDLTWTDNSAYEDGFRIERALTSGGAFSEIATVNVDVTTYRDTNLSASTTYFYRVSAFNTAGVSAASSEASATTLPPPDVTAPAAVANLAVASVTSSSATLTWTAPGDDGVTGTASAYDLRYSTSPITEGNWNAATQITGEPSPSVAGSAESFVVNGLNSDTTYYFALKTSDETNNVSPLSNLASATTPDVTAPAAVANLAVASVTSSSATLTWTAPGDDGMIGTATAYDLRYSTAPITEGNWNAATQVAGEPSPSVAGAPESFTVNGLNSDTAYYFALKTSDETNNASPLSNVASGATPDVTAPAAIANLAVVSVTSSSATLTWTAPGDDGTIGTATTYDVRYGTAPITAGNWASATLATGEPVPVAAGSPQSFAVTGLNSDTTYYFALKTSDEANNISPLSNVASGTTPDVTAPAAVANLAVASVTSSSATLTWAAPGDDGVTGTASAYDVRYSTTPITAGNWASAPPAAGEPAPVVAGSPQSFVVTGLSSDRTYYFALKTSDEANNISPLSSVASGTTPDVTAPAAVANLAVASVTSSSATLTWTARGDDGAIGTATTYDIRYSTSAITAANWASATAATGEPLPAVAGSAQSFAVTGLSSGRTYYFGLKTSDEANNISPISNVPLATTAGVPSPWLSQDIGAVAVAGSVNHTNGAFTVRGSGADIAGTLDEFRYVYQAANGNCEIIARVAAVQNTHSAAKAAVMIRESLNANARHATMALTPANNLSFLRRASTGGGTSTTAGGSGTAPYWVRLVRSGNTFTAYKSTNGTSWTTVGSDTVNMGANIYIGLAVTSHSDGTLNTSRFDNVSATP